MLLSSRAASRLQQTALRPRATRSRTMSVVQASKQVISTDK